MMSITGIDWSKLLAEKPYNDPTDPYFVWADMTMFAGYFATPPSKTTVVSFLVEAKQSASQQTQFKTASIKLGDVWGQLVNLHTTVRWQFAQARGDYAAVEAMQVDRQAARVVAAVLDDGCPLFNQTYMHDGSSTRVKWLWHQGRVAEAHANYWKPLVGASNTPWYGAELTPKAIDDVIAQHADEDDRYRALDYLSGPGSIANSDVSKARYHGASVLSQVSGSPSTKAGSEVPDVPNNAACWPTIFVQFPSAEPFDTTGGWLGLRVFDGLLYVLDRARRGYVLPRGERKPVPVVACISYGGLAGPHDGTSMLERAVVSLLETHQHLHVVLPAGNGNDHAIHAIARAQQKLPAVFRVFAPPDCPSPCFVEIWLPESIQSRLNKVVINVKTPDGKETLSLAGTGAVKGRNSLFGVVFARRVAQGQSGSMILIAIQSTRIHRLSQVAQAAVAPAGVWKISVSAPSCVLNAWIERDDIVGTVPRDQQARFVGASFEPESAPTAEARVDERSTLSSIANAVHERLYVVGSIYAFPPVVANGVSSYTASGPSIATTNPRVGPDLSARADVAPSLRGVVVDGARTGDTYRSSGTSVAAGIAARYLLHQISMGANLPPRPTLPLPRRGTTVP